MLHAARRGTRQDFLKKVTTLHYAASRGSVSCAVDITRGMHIPLNDDSVKLSFGM